MRRGHSKTLEAAGVAWVLAAAFLTTSQFARRETSLPSGVASTTQVVGVAALLAATLCIVWALFALGSALSRDGDRFGSIVVRSAATGIVLLPLFLIGLYSLIPALLALGVRGRLGGVGVRLSAAALLAGLVVAGVASMWPSGTEGTIPLYVLSFLGGTVEGVALIWFARRTEPLG
ncbi:MAG: hypothetical protein M3134_04230 [Actinomycetota bacterium]|nr:hypothetical protein [Actinomycetota bacterium]